MTGVLIVLAMRMLGEMATTRPTTGSFTDYANEALGGWAGFSVAWLYWYFWVVVVGFEAVAGAKILLYWFGDVPVWPLAFGLMVLMVATNLFSVGSFGEFWFAGIKVAAIAVFIVLGGLYAFGAWPGNSADFSNLLGHGGLLPKGGRPSSAAWWWWCSRWSAPKSPPSPLRSPTTRVKAIAHATRSVVLRLGVFYVLAIFLLTVIVPWNSMVLGASPFVSAFKTMGIPGADHLMNAVVLTAVLSCLNSGVYTASRMLFVLAERRQAPAGLTKLNGKGVPVAAILMTSVGGFLCVIAAYVWPDTVFMFLLNSSGAVILFVYLIIAASQLVLRLREPNKTRLVKMWVFPRLTLATIAALVALLVQMGADRKLRRSFA